MALSNTLFAGLSGLDVNQVKLNVVGNNIANVNTVAFKSSRAIFKPQFYITDSGGSQPDENNGGTNPSQRGLGAVVAGVERNFAPGSIETTGRSTDMAIDGDGFFVVKSDETKYTRDGAFVLNPRNELVTNAGDYVQGYAVDTKFNIVSGRLTNVTIPMGLTTAEATSEVLLNGNLDAAGTVASGASILTSQLFTTLAGTAPTGTALLTDIASTSDPAVPLFNVGDVYTLVGQKAGNDLTSGTFTVAAGSTLDDLAQFYQDHFGINTGVGSTPPPGVTVEADAADPTSARLVVTGNLGAGNVLGLPAGSFLGPSNNSPFSFVDGSNAAGVQSNPSGESINTSFMVYDSLGTEIRIGMTAILESTSASGTNWRFFVDTPSPSGGSLSVGTGTLSFDNAGNLSASSGASIAIDRGSTGAYSPLTVTLDFSRMRALSQSSELGATANGSYVGHLTSYSIGTDGKITGTFSNGVNRTLGQVAIATFPNQQGLVDRGGNMFVEGADSGQAVVGAPGTMGSGRIVSGSLELSNVDLSEEFINLIIASTGFNAASRVISTADQLLTALLNTSR